MRSQVHKPVPLNISHSADVVPGGQHKLLVESPLWVCGPGMWMGADAPFGCPSLSDSDLSSPGVLPGTEESMGKISPPTSSHHSTLQHTGRRFLHS